MKLFGTAGIRGGVRERVTPALALAVGRAAGDAAERDADDEKSDGNDGSNGERTSGATSNEFVLAADGRETGSGLAAAVEAGLLSAGTDVRRAGQLPTPALAFASRGRRGVMVTASHNPPADNGLKLFADGEEYDRDAERRIEERVAADPAPVAWDRWGTIERIDPLPAYREAVVTYACGHGAALDGLRIVVDCANGTASRATPQVLRALGAEVVALNASVDGHFSGRPSKPTPETLGDLRAFLADEAGPDEADPDGERGNPEDPDAIDARPQDATDEGFALGIAHDGDGDRVVFLDSEGEIVHEDTVLAILAEHYARASDATDPIVVTTPNASSRVDERVAAAGGRTERIGLGALHEGIAAVRESGSAGTEVAFAAEPWKHVHPAFGPWIDGVASAAVLARLAAESGLDALRAPVTELPYRKASLACADGRKGSAMAELARTLPERFPEAAVETEHGLRLDFEEEWVLVRPSGTEPKIRVYAESETVDALLERVVDAVEAATDGE
jgi:phosphomannomutase